jgi:catechol 2,3-dioxygenase-like lactoylglutathione lyase family enzyme
MSPARGFVPHHVAISVRDLDATAEFYGVLGFRKRLEWRARDGSLTIAHFATPDGYFLEAFAFADNASLPPLDLTMGNDLPRIGVKHFSFAVDDLEATRAELVEHGIESATEIGRGRTEMDFFFVRDPDGMWIEITQDARDLSSDEPRLNEG